ncbi:MAG TPA: cyclic beta 1-2 glucan synthetase, partial [Chitinophagales bacterium]|nr:cyclic beta 1-2 glucan synthetase [Chitinophagales bacterium]
MEKKINPQPKAIISNLKKLLKVNGNTTNYLIEEPMRDELFSSEQMIQYGKSLAAQHVISTKPSKDHLLKRLANNEMVLQEIRKVLNDTIKNNYQITPAGEWLIDNFYLIEEHIRIAKTHFPKHYSEDLPQIIIGKSTGITRSYDITLQVISHNDGRINIENLSKFLEAYQSVTHLKLGELWSIPIMLRLALIENIRRVSARLANDRIERNLANYWAIKMIETAETAPKDIVIALADMARSKPPITSAFVAELIRQLRGKGPDIALVLNWVEQQLSGSGLTGAEMVNAENQKQAADQVSISNSIASLRILATIDWKKFVESHSIVEKILLQDNNGIYGNMDFSTRDHYRHVVEHIAKKSALSEEGVAQIAIQLMHEDRATADSDPRTAHVGYYLIGKGVSETKKRVKMHLSGIEKMQNYFKRHALFFYLTCILIVSIAIGAAIFFKVFSESNTIWLLVTISVIAVISASQLAISVVNFFTTLLVKPELLPRMDFSNNIPDSARTLIVVPTLLTNVDELENLLEALEVRFLANRKDNLYFGLLTDFTDADQEFGEEDEILVDTAKKGIEALNIKYKRNKNNLFFLFHRPRIWNPKENVWMGYERKRGKLSDLNLLLRENSSDHFSVIVGEPSIFPTIKYVITLDTDTKLPLNTAWKLVASMAHPLNRAWYDERKKRVTKGYGILQPRVTISLPDISSSRYRKMHGNEPGIDPYTRASSDVYQDLFAEGSYIGKGIYDVDIFHKVLEGKFPKNRILSHDLLEGCYIRSGLLSDVQLFEKYPPTYRADMKVRLRWLRGDWQIISWLFPVVPGPQKQRYKNPISGLSRWKIFDNIRRSFVPIAHTLFLLLTWIFLPSVLFWTIAISLIIVFPIFITTLFDIFRKPKNVLLRYHVKNSYQNLQEVTVKTLFTLISLPYEAYVNLKGILRTLWRMLISKKYLLEWEPSANTSKENQSGLVAAYVTMWFE